MADATLRILLTAKDEASRVLNNAGKEAEGFGNKIKAAGLAVGAFAAGFVSFHALEGALEATKELGSEVRQLARETGLSAEDASRFIFVLKELGQTGDDASKPLGILAKNVVNTRDALKQGKDATSPFANSMKVLGISFVQANGQVKPTNELLFALADRFKALPDGAEKTARAIDIFGRSGKDMIPILNLGSQGIKELGAEADKLGVTLSADNVEKIRLYQRAQRELNEALLGVKVTIATAIIPTLTQFSQWFTEHQGDVRKFVQDAIAAIGSFAKDFKAGFDIIIEGLSWIPDHKGQIIAAIAAIGVAMVAAFGPESLALAGLTAIVALIGRVGQHQGTFFSDLETKITNARDFQGGGTVPGTFGQGTFDPKAGFGDTIAKFDEAARKAGESAADAGVDLDALGPKIKDATKTLGEVLLGALSKIGAAATALFSRPTREQAIGQLGLDKAQLAFDSLTQSVNPLKFGLDVLKDSVAADERAFNLHRLAMSDAADALSDQASDLDKKIRDLQRADSNGGGGGALSLAGGGPVAIQGGNGGAINAGGGPPGSGNSALEALQRQRENLADQQQALQRRIRDEEKAFQRDQLTKQENIRRQQDLVDKQVQAEQRKLDSLRLDQTLEKDRRTILQDQLTLADKTLLTDSQQYELAKKLIEKTSDFTGKIAAAATAAGVTLVDGFDDAMNAEAALAKMLREETITAFQGTSGAVRDLGDAIAPLLAMLRAGPIAPQSSKPFDPSMLPAGFGQ